MKRDMDNLNLRDAFRQEPDFCHAALMNAACSVKEEKQVKRASIRVVLIAAVIIVAMSAVAFAAGTLMGWTDFYGDYSNVGVPQAAVDEMQVQEGDSWQVGPLTFTVKELLTDGHIAMSSIHIRTTDGSPALLTSWPYDPIGANGENGEALAKRLGVDPALTGVEAAKQLGIPLYDVRGILDVAPELSGVSMEDPMWNEDNSLTYFSMPTMNSEAVANELPVGFFLRVAQIDPATGEEIAKWIDRDQKTVIPVSPVLEEKTYVPEGEAEVLGYTLESVHAKRYVTGAYLTLNYDVTNGLMDEKVFDLYDVTLHDAQGSELPGGMNLSARIKVSVVLEEMIGVDALPDTITLSDGTVVVAK